VNFDWADYLAVHSSRTNLLIHLLAVPLFIAGFVAIFLPLSGAPLFVAGAGVPAMLVALGLQGFGHRHEVQPPRPFTGPGNFLRRWFTEQFLIFPMFVLSGRWWSQYRRAVDPAR